MLHRSLKTDNKGFTIIEILVVLVVTSIVGVTAIGLFSSSINQYFGLQQSSVQFGDLTLQSQRIANVLRGLTDITSANTNDLTVYSYFSPNDNYVSLLHYYVNGSKFMADVTHMTANPPIGTPITSSLITYTVVDNFYTANNVNTFEYLDATGAIITLPISNLNSIKGIRINLAIPSTQPQANGSVTISTQVSLRNRKTNL